MLSSISHFLLVSFFLILFSIYSLCVLLLLILISPIFLLLNILTFIIRLICMPFFNRSFKDQNKYLYLNNYVTTVNVNNWILWTDYFFNNVDDVVFSYYFYENTFVISDEFKKALLDDSHKHNRYAHFTLLYIKILIHEFKTTNYSIELIQKCFDIINTQYFKIDEKETAKYITRFKFDTMTTYKRWFCKLTLLDRRFENTTYNILMNKNIKHS